MKITLGQSLGYSALGFAIVFAALIALIVVIWLVSKFVVGNGKKKAAAPQPAAAPAPVPVQDTRPAPAAIEPIGGKVPAAGSLGNIDLNGVEPRTAAMLMAIVAEKTGLPLNRLRFTAIKEIREDK